MNMNFIGTSLIPLPDHGKRCVVFGTTRLCICILEQLISNEWNILSVLSDDEIVINYCRIKKLGLVQKLDQIKCQRFILFSVANYTIIADSFLNSHDVILAINYHDSLLPKYAGLNSTTWAIYNNEKTHGVTWHLISSETDEGEILKQSKIDISPNETAFSLNIKCVEKAARLFRSLLKELESKSIKVRQQDTTKKTYFGKDYVCENYGVIDFNNDFEGIDRLCRSLDFGDAYYINPVASLKVWDGKSLYQAGSLSFQEKEDAIPGFVYSISDSILSIGIKGGKLSINNLLTLEGDSVTFDKTNFHVGKVTHNHKVNKAEKSLISKMKKEESKLFNLLKDEKWQKNKFFHLEAGKKNSEQYNVSIAINNLNSEIVFSKLTFTLLNYINNDLSVPIYIDHIFESRFLNKLINLESFIQLSLSKKRSSYKDFSKVIINQMADRYLVSKDFFCRYHLNARYDVKISFYSEKKYKLNKNIDRSRLSIIITENNLYINGLAQDKVILDSFCSFLNSNLNEPEEIIDNKIQRLTIIPSHESQTDHPCLENQEDFLALIEAKAKTTPQATAVIFENQSVNYSALNHSANQFARYLQTKGATKEVVIAIGLDRSIEYIIALLGILKADSAFLPLDPMLPEARLQFMLKDSRAKILITQSNKKVFNNFKGTKIFLDRDLKEIGKKDARSLKVNYLETNANRLVYVLYTSGSTGKPKGVEIVRSSLNNLLQAMQKQWELSSFDRWLALSTISFDISILDILLPLRQGATLVFGTREISTDPILLGKALNENGITFAQATPTTWQMLLDSNWQGKSDLTILSGGEALSRLLASKLQSISYSLWNGYGPTEATIYSSWKKIQSFSETITIGYPIANAEFYILDEEKNLLPVGVPGELYIGGAGLARSYRNRPDLTDERFIFTSLGRLYKTGDLVRCLPNGEIEYLGRTDTQVKIHGYRIELGEIEELLSKCANVKQAVVIARKEKFEGFRIVAYYQGEADIVKIKEELSSYLPSYMLPSAFVQIAKFPLNANGKIDRNALPAPNYKLNKSSFIAPSSPLEIEIINIFEEVLNVEPIETNDNFFALGGHSLSAARAITKINHTFQTNLTLKALLESPSPALLAKEIQKALPKVKTVEKITKTSSKSLGLSPSQQGIWLSSHQTPESALYSVPFILEMRGKLDIFSLQKTLQTIVNRHEILRTIFMEKSEHVESVILEHLDVYLSRKDLSKKPNSDMESENICQLEAQNPFNLSRGPLFRFLLIKILKTKHYLFLNFHHMIFDGISANLFIHELKILYEDFIIKNKQSCLKDVSIQYNDYIAWKLSQPIAKEHISFWLESLQDALPILNLPIDKPKPRIQTYKGSLLEFPIATTDEMYPLKKLVNRQTFTLFSVLLAAYYVFLTRYTGQHDIVIGIPVSGRTHDDLNPLIGSFVNSLPFRTEFSRNISFLELIQKIRNDWLKSYDKQDVPFEKIVQELKQERSLRDSPIFQTMFNLIPKIDIDKIGNLDIRLRQVDRGMAHFDLSLSIQETSEGLVGIFEYKTDLFFSETIKQMAKHFQNLTKDIITNPESSINKLRLLDDSEIHEIINEWNTQKINYSKNATIISLIEKTAEKNPNNIAIICGGESYTYSQLNKKANRIAHFLLSKGIKNEDKVVVYLERSALFLPAILGILKAGGAYVPLDPKEPTARRDPKLQELIPFCILTENLLKNQVSHSFIVCIDDLPKSSTINPRSSLSNDQLAYIIYTSGTTGEPKGVEIEHKSINDRVLWKQAAYPLNTKDVMLHTYSFIFDGAIINYFWPLCIGAKLVIATKEEQLDSEALIELIQEHRVTTMDLLPSLLQGLVNEKKFSNCPSLKNIFSGGEVLPMGLVRSFFSKSSAKLHNTYGPTEATVEASVWECTPDYENGAIAPIGKPIAGAKLYILDTNGNIVPKRVPGELHIGGIGLARGYFNDPIATQEKFITSYFNGERLYQTGDMVKYLKDGTIEFLGRIDSYQMKIRGYRIDLREIESALTKIDPIEKAIIVPKGNGDNKYLIAYVKINTKLDEAMLLELMKHSLSKHLPSYMIPRQVCIIEQFPVLLNGKIDVKNLPEPINNIKKAIIKNPKNKQEKQLLSIWKEVLELPVIQIDDNFFEIGGNSLLAMRLMVKIRNKMRYSITQVQFFQNPTIEALAQSLKEKKNKKSWSPLVPMKTNGHKEPFFCVHPAGGGVMCYNSLVKYWGNDRPFYALQAYGLEEGQFPLDSIEKMAREYIKAIRRLQKTGPYYLGGWSFGGIVAAEMVNQLRQMRETVGSLVLIDTTANIEKFQKINTEDEGQLLAELTQYFHKEHAVKSSLSFKEQLVRFIDNGGKRGLRRQESQIIDQLILLAKANYRAIKKFTMPILDTNVFLLKTESNLEEDLGWHRYAKHVTILKVPGDHWAITQSKTAYKYARTIQKCFPSVCQ